MITRNERRAPRPRSHRLVAWAVEKLLALLRSIDDHETSAAFRVRLDPDRPPPWFEDLARDIASAHTADYDTDRRARLRRDITSAMLEAYRGDRRRPHLNYRSTAR